MQVLVVQPHEGQLDTRKLAFRNGGLGAAEAQLAHLLPMRVRRAAHADARDLKDRRAHVVLRHRRPRAQHAQTTHRGQAADAGRRLKQLAPRQARLHGIIVKFNFHSRPP